MQLNRVEKKRLYDIGYRKKNSELIQKRKALYYEKIKDTPKYKSAMKAYRESVVERHVAYCARPDQKKKTRARDIYRSHGEYRECFELCMEIIHYVEAYYKKNACGVAPAYARRKARGYYEVRLADRRERRRK